MKLDLGDYQIITDDRNFIVQQKKVVQAHRLAKEENIGKETWIDVAYCNTFEIALKFLSNRAFIDNDDIKDVLKQIRLYEVIVRGLISKLNIEVEGLKNE